MREHLVLSLALVGALGCNDLCASKRLPTCDIRLPECHAQVQAIVGCMRGITSSALPPVTLMTTAEYEAYLRAGSDPMMMRMTEAETSLKLLGLLDPRADLFETSVADSLTNVAAFYSLREDAVYVIDRGMPADSVESVESLAHELVHAAQDEEHDLGALLDAVDTLEELFVLRSTVEGEAMFYTGEAAAWSYELRPERVDWPRFYDDFLMDTRARIDASPSPFFVVTGRLPYVLGGRWQAFQWQEGGDPAVRAGLDRPPASSAALMIDLFEGEELLTSRVDPWCEAPPPPEGFTAGPTDELGAPLVYAFLHRWGMTHAEAWSLALRWRRDDLYLYSAPDGRVALAWRIVFGDTSAPRWTATQVLDAAPDVFRAGYADDTVLLVASDDPAAMSTWSWTDRNPACGPPPL